METKKIYVVTNCEELNKIGCEFIIQSKNNKTFLTSTELRWLTVKREVGCSTTFAERQSYAKELINKCANSDIGKLKLEILLYRNPKKLRYNGHIVQLIKAGADIRVLKMNKFTKIFLSSNRLCLSVNRLFISYAPSIECVVNSGVDYTGISDVDPLINYYKGVFQHFFEKSRKIIVKNDKLLFDDKWYQYLFKTMKDISLKEFLIAFFGAILALAITVLFKYIFGISV